MATVKYYRRIGGEQFDVPGDVIRVSPGGITERWDNENNQWIDLGSDGRNHIAQLVGNGDMTIDPISETDALRLVRR